MSKSRAAIRGVYAITPDEPRTDVLCKQVADALEGGVRLFQYRNKAATRSLARAQAVRLRAITANAGACLIVNDDIELALEVRADGVHLGRDDRDARVDFSSIRRCASASTGVDGRFMIGVSCYDKLQLARAALLAGADYIAFGAFFPSSTKPHAVPAELSLIRRAKEEFTVPVVAIGGITIENAPQLVAAGVDSIAVISSMFGASDICARAREFTLIFPDDDQEQPKII